MIKSILMFLLLCICIFEKINGQDTLFREVSPVLWAKSEKLAVAYIKSSKIKVHYGDLCQLINETLRDVNELKKCQDSIKTEFEEPMNRLCKSNGLRENFSENDSITNHFFVFGNKYVDKIGSKQFKKIDELIKEVKTEFKNDHGKIDSKSIEHLYDDLKCKLKILKSSSKQKDIDLVQNLDINFTRLEDNVILPNSTLLSCDIDVETKKIYFEINLAIASNKDNLIYEAKPFRFLTKNSNKFCELNYVGYTSAFFNLTSGRICFSKDLEISFLNCIKFQSMCRYFEDNSKCSENLNPINYTQIESVDDEVWIYCFGQRISILGQSLIDCPNFVFSLMSSEKFNLSPSDEIESNKTLGFNDFLLNRKFNSIFFEKRDHTCLPVFGPLKETTQMILFLILIIVIVLIIILFFICKRCKLIKSNRSIRSNASNRSRNQAENQRRSSQIAENEF